MKIASVDCGTTNSRVYIIDETGEILGKGVRPVGVRDTTISGSRDLLKEGLKEAFIDALTSASVRLEEIDFSIAAGMITSEIGLLDIPHLPAPAGMQDIARNIKRIHDLSIFPMDTPIHFVPGVRNPIPPKVEPEQVGILDFMRGEEAQVAGLISKGFSDKRSSGNGSSGNGFTAVVLSSHTKFIPVDSGGRILGSVTTLSGQVYEAVKKETSIGKSIRGPAGNGDAEFFDTRIVDNAYEQVKEAGLLRTLMMSRFFDVLMDTQWYERRLFLEAALAAEDLLAVRQFHTLGYPVDTPMILVGKEVRCSMYKHLLKKHMAWGGEIQSITGEKEIDELNIQGSLYLARLAGICKS